MQTLRLLTIISFCLACLTASGCASTTAGGAVGAQRTQLLLVSSAELENMAEQSYAKLKAESNSKGALNRDAALLKRVRAIAMRIKPHTAVFRADAPAWNWEAVSSAAINC